MSEKTVLLIIASEGYQPTEYGHTRKALEAAGIRVLVASDAEGTAHAKPITHIPKECDSKCAKDLQERDAFETVEVNIDLTAVDINNYDGIFIIGGPGAMQFLDNQALYKIMRDFAKTGKPYGAICVSPRILGNAGLLEKKNATGWNGDQQLEELFAQFKADYIKQSVVIDGLLITADGPHAAAEFGGAIVKLLRNV